MTQICTQSDKYEDFCDGSYFKTHPLFSGSRFALQIQLDYDEFESANPLGKKKKRRTYLSWQLLLHSSKSSTQCEFCFNEHSLFHCITCMFYAQDAKKYGVDEILKPLVKDLKMLETTGAASSCIYHSCTNYR